MLDMARAACRDPEPGDDGEALETIGAALAAADALVAEEDGIRAAIDLVYRAIVRAATEVPDHQGAAEPLAERALSLPRPGAAGGRLKAQ